MRIKISRKIQVDKSIAKGIKFLNVQGFHTLNCCSGLPEEHLSKRDKLFVDFYIPSNLANEIKLICRDIGFKYKERNGILHIENSTENKLKVFDKLIEKIKSGKYKLNLRTMGISNWCQDSLETVKKNLYSVQFYDYDGILTEAKLNRILEIFPYDCLLYKTKHGYQFISFAILHGLKITKTRALELSKMFGQDYFTEAKDLTLRVSSKRNDKNQIISEKPKFESVLKEPNNYICSENHFNFYEKYMGLPPEAANLYEGCNFQNFKIKIYHYKTRD